MQQCLWWRHRFWNLRVSRKHENLNISRTKCCFFINRPWHDAVPVLSPAQIKKKESWAGNEKPAQRQSCVGWYRLHKIVNSSSRIHFNWFNRIHFKLILLTLLFKSLFFKTNLNYSYNLLLDIFSFITQWGFCKYVFSKKLKTDFFCKSAFGNRK